MQGKVSSLGAKPVLCKLVLAVQIFEPEAPPQYWALTGGEDNKAAIIATRTKNLFMPEYFWHEDRKVIGGSARQRVINVHF